MSAVGELLTRMADNNEREALVWNGRSFRFVELLQRAAEVRHQFIQAGVHPGAVVAIEGDFSPTAVATLLAVFAFDGIAVPLTATVESKKPEFRETAQIEWTVRIAEDDGFTLTATGVQASQGLFALLRQSRHAGIVLFSSGSTGRSKAVVHDVEQLMAKYLQPRHCYRTLAFLLFDHIGGLDTLLYNLANGSCLVTIRDHGPETVCAAISAHSVEVLPASPTFLNLLLLNGAHERYDLSCLRVITYGAEVMPESILARLHAAFPQLKFLQKFGTTEVGTLRSQSRESGSVWVKIGGEGYQTRVREGLLEIKANSAMLGYLNAPSPFTEDGWFMTGDAVEMDGEWMRILGRRSEMINVGGEKVYPAEIENILQSLENVAEVTVFGEKHPLTGHIVVARFRLLAAEDAASFRARVRAFCQGKLERYKVPARILIVEDLQHSSRFKKMRLNTASTDFSL